MQKLWILIGILFITNYSFAFNIVYPKTKNATVSANTTFFIGSSKNPVTINGTPVPLHKTGAFAYFVKLPDSINTFVIKSSDMEETYTIKKLSHKKNMAEQKFIKYQTIKPLIVEVNNTPLRETPVNDGINRISHLQKGVLLTADGEKGSFYRVKLNHERRAWIMKSSVKETTPFTPAKINGYNFSEDKDFYILSFNLDKKVPFEIIEGSTIKLNFFNTDRQHHYGFPYREKTKNDKLYGYSGIYQKNSSEFILKIRKPPEKTLKNIVITIDPGHGGKEKGGIGCFGDNEKDIVLNISSYLKKELENKGAKVIMTREDDREMNLYSRVDIANSNNSVLFISIHNNALPDTLDPNTHRGTSVYYYYNQAKPLAEAILHSMVNNLGTNNDGLHQRSFAVVRNTSAVSVLVEVAYLINPDDNELLTNPSFWQNTAVSITKGIENYLLSKP